MAGRTKKPTEQLKLQGTYRKDRHEQNPDIILKDLLDIPIEIIPPENITDKFCIEHYSYHVNLLIKLKILTASDITERNILYETLQQYRKIQNELQQLDIINDIDKYTQLTKLSLALSRNFSSIARQYYISPAARTKLQIDLQNLKDIQEKKSLTKKLIERKKS